MTLDEKKKYRLIFLKKLYEVTDGNERVLVDMFQLGNEIGIPNNAVRPTAQYLDGEGLIEFKTLGGGISITHAGVLEIEEAINNPNERTEHFPPINIINIKSMDNSVIQQGSSGGIQNVSFSGQDFEQIKKIIDELDARINQINLEPEKHKELKQEIETIKVQMASPKPKATILNESLRTIKDILLSVTANVYTPIIIELIKNLLKV